MKKIILLSLVLTSLVWVALACTNSTSGSGSSAPPSSVVVGATVTYGGSDNFSPSTVTITHGQAVVWDSTFNGAHTVYVDGFSGTTVPGGGCGTPLLNTTSFPVTLVFPTAGTYNYHCSNHSSCSSSQCGLCNGGLGMAGSVVVN
jgi:plastocyanin